MYIQTDTLADSKCGAAQVVAGVSMQVLFRPVRPVSGPDVKWKRLVLAIESSNLIYLALVH